MQPPIIHHTTAQFANFTAIEACTLLANQADEAFETSMDYVQLCPQTPTVFTEDTLSEVQKAFPNTQFQLHANVRVQPGLLILDASSYSDRNHWYFERLGELSAFIKAPAYSLHSGRRRHCTMKGLFHNLEAIQTLFTMPVLVEGMYPTRDGSAEYLMSTWQEYIDVMNSGLCYAIDLSHLHIVANREGQRPDWVYQLITHPNCRRKCTYRTTMVAVMLIVPSPNAFGMICGGKKRGYLLWLIVLRTINLFTSRKGCIELVHTGTTSLPRTKGNNMSKETEVQHFARIVENMITEELGLSIDVPTMVVGKHCPNYSIYVQQLNILDTVSMRTIELTVHCI